jgi:hypothetical protein
VPSARSTLNQRFCGVRLVCIRVGKVERKIFASRLFQAILATFLPAAKTDGMLRARCL